MTPQLRNRRLTLLEDSLQRIHQPLHGAFVVALTSSVLFFWQHAFVGLKIKYIDDRIDRGLLEPRRHELVLMWTRTVEHFGTVRYAIYLHFCNYPPRFGKSWEKNLRQHKVHI